MKFVANSFLPLALVLCLQPCLNLQAQETSRRRRRPKKSAADIQASRLLKKAQDFISLKEHERGVKMLQTVIDQYPASFVRYQAYLTFGKHYVDTHKEADAIRAFAKIKELKKTDEQLKGEPLEVFLESLYLTGVAFYKTRQYNTAFPVLRRITRNYPNTIWANQAYYYIGMCHFMQENWNKAIEALSLVGTFVDQDEIGLEYIEAGHRFFAKITDADLSILRKLGKQITIGVETKNGDNETITCIPLSGKGEIYIGSLPTDVGIPGPEVRKDGILQVLGGDTITATYVDDNTIEGKHNVMRRKITKVVSTGTLRFTLGTYEGQASAAFIGQPVFLVLKDADLDKSELPEKVTLKVMSRYKIEEEDDSNPDLTGVDVDKLFEEEKKERYATRDEVQIELKELGREPIRSGKFGGSVQLIWGRGTLKVDRTDKLLACEINDEVLATYTDNLHIGGDYARDVHTTLVVVGEIDGRPRATQNVVFNAMVKARKNAVEGKAYQELGRIFRDMGLIDGAKIKCVEGLEKIDSIINIRAPIPRDMKEEAYKLKWETQMVMGDLAGALQTCQVFNRLFPDSPLVDHALKEVATIYMENKKYAQAVRIFRQILALKNSQVKAEAAFRIAECTEDTRGLASAVPHYKFTSTKFPDSEFAGPSMAKEIDYFYVSRDYAQANELLEQIFQDYPDAPFLDKMLIKWVLVSYRMGDYQKAKEKCSQLLFEYPSSSFASTAKKILPRIEKKLAKIKAAPKPAEGQEQ